MLRLLLTLALYVAHGCPDAEAEKDSRRPVPAQHEESR